MAKRAPWMPSRAEEKERERAEKARTRYGVFLWVDSRMSNAYPQANAIAVYKSEALARKAADKANLTWPGTYGGYVVRTFTIS